jgi:hypothetical protein
VNVTLKAIVSNLAVINFPSSILEKGEEPGRLRVGVAGGELSRLIETDMKCQVEYPDKSLVDVKIKEIIRDNGRVLLECVPAKFK